MKKIGNKQDGSLEELMKKAVDDPVIDDIVKGKDPKIKQKYQTLNLQSNRTSDQLIKGIEDYFKFWEEDEKRLVQGDLIGNIYVTDNALLAVAYAGTGKITKAGQIIAGIESRFGFIAGTVAQGPDETETMANHSLAIAYGVLGRKKDADKLLKALSSSKDSTRTHGLDVWTELALRNLAYLSNGHIKRAMEREDISALFQVFTVRSKVNRALLGAFQNAVTSIDSEYRPLIDDFKKDMNIVRMKKGKLVLDEKGLANCLLSVAAAVAYQTDAYLMRQKSKK